MKPMVDGRWSMVANASPETSALAFPLLAILLLSAAPALAEETPSLPVGIWPPGTVRLTQAEFNSAEWYKEDLSTGAEDDRIRMDCGTRALQSILPNSYEAPFDQPDGYLNICVPTEKRSHTDSNWKYYFSLDPPVYMHPDFNLGLNIIIPNFYGTETVYRGQFEHWVFEEKIDPISGEHYEEATVYTLKVPKMKWTVILVDGFGRELEYHQHDLSSPAWNARANVDFYLPLEVGMLRAIPLDPLNKDRSRYYPYRTPPMVVSAALSSTIHVDNPRGPDAGPGWDVDVYPAFGTAILQPTTGIEALPPPEDIGVFNDAGTSQLTAKWLPVDGTQGYLIYTSPSPRAFFQPYDSSPFGHQGGEWFPQDVWTLKGLTLLTGDSASCFGASAGYPGEKDPNDKYENYVFVVPVGPQLDKDSPYYQAGRPSRAFGIGGDGYFLTLDQDGNPRVRGPVVKSYAHDAQTHGIHDVAVGAVRSIPGMGFGTHPGELLLDGKPLPWSRVVEWSDWLIRLTAGTVSTDGTLEIRDHDGVVTKTALATIGTKPSLGEPPVSHAVLGQPFLIPWQGKTPELPPVVSVNCDLSNAPGAGQIEVDKTLVNTGTGNLEVYFKLQDKGDPPHFCPCNLTLPVEAADGKAMLLPDWNWAFWLLPSDVKSHMVVRRMPKGSPFLQGTYTEALKANGIDTGNGISFWQTPGDTASGPSPVLVKNLKGLAWSFGDLARHPLTATDMAAILAVLQNGNNVLLAGRFFLRELADGDPAHFGATGLKLQGYRAVQLSDHLDVPVDSPAFDFFPGQVDLREECRTTVAYLPIPTTGCHVVMTAKTTEGDRPAVVICEGHLLVSGVPDECLPDGVVSAWVAAMDWN